MLYLPVKVLTFRIQNSRSLKIFLSYSTLLFVRRAEQNRQIQHHVVNYHLQTECSNSLTPDNKMDFYETGTNSSSPNLLGERWEERLSATTIPHVGRSTRLATPTS